MINLFSPSPKDQSIYYLGQIFGPVGTVLQVDSSSLLMGKMFNYFNSVVLSVAALIVLYVTIVGVVKTAAEGEFLGREWNSIWVPIRMVLGIAALVPSGTGYCAMQIITMWIVIQGIGAADTIWNTVLNYTNTMGSPLATTTMPTVGVNSSMKSMFQALVCQSSAHANYSYTTPSSSNGGYYCYNRNDSFCATTNDSAGLLNIKGSQASKTTGSTGGKTQYLYQYNFGPDGACGFMYFVDAEKTCTDTSTLDKQIACSAAQGQQTALQSAMSVLGGIAQQFVQADYEYRQFFDYHAKAPDWIASYCSSNGIPEEQCCYSSNVQLSGIPTQGQTGCALSPSFSSGDANNAANDPVTNVYWPYNIQANLVGNIDFIATTANNYTTTINNAIASAVTQAGNQQTFSNQTYQQANDQGWLFAGAYYYYLAGQTGESVKATQPTLTVTVKNPKASKSSLTNLRNNFEAATKMLSVSSKSQDTLSKSMTPEIQGLSELTSSMNDGAQDMSNAFMNAVTGASSGKQVTNPLTALAALGDTFIIIAKSLFAAALVVVPFLTLGFLDIFIGGTGSTNVAGPTVATLMIFFAPLYAILVGSLFAFGALLAVYTPLIPYIVYTMAAIGWFILVIEGMVSAPIVALGILAPAGGHEILGKGGASLYYLFGLFLRPGLMVFGMMAAMLMAMVVVTMINAGFAGVMGSIMSDYPGYSSGGSSGYGNAGYVEIIMFGCAYVMLILAALNKTFELIYYIPDTVLRWIGGQPERTDVTAGLSAAEKGATAGAGAAMTGAKEMLGAEKGAFESMKATHEARKAKKKGGPAPILQNPPEK